MFICENVCNMSSYKSEVLEEFALTGLVHEHQALVIGLVVVDDHGRRVFVDGHIADLLCEPAASAPHERDPLVIPAGHVHRRQTAVRPMVLITHMDDNPALARDTTVTPVRSLPATLCNSSAQF